MEQPNHQESRFNNNAQMSHEPAGFWRRFLAQIIDQFIIGICMLPITFVILAPMMTTVIEASQQGVEPILPTWYYIVSYAQWIIPFFYSGFMLSKKGATLGRMAMGLKVIDIGTGSNPSFLKSAFRDTVGRMISAIILLIGYLMAPFRKDKKSMHDLIFSTWVLKIK